MKMSTVTGMDLDLPGPKVVEHQVMKLLLLISLLLGALQARALIQREDIGELKIHHLLIRPNFLLKEPRDGLFSIGESSFALRWELENKFIGVVRIGPRTLLNPLVHYNSTVNSDIMLVEAYPRGPKISCYQNRNGTKQF